MNNNSIFPPLPRRRRNVSNPDVVKVDSLASNSSFNQGKVPSSSAHIRPSNPRNVSSAVKVQPPVRPELPIISKTSPSVKITSSLPGSKATPKIGARTMPRTRSHSSSCSLNNLGEPSSADWRLKRDIKTSSTSTATSSKYVYSPFATTRFSAKLSPSQSTSKSLCNSPVMKKPPRPDFPSGFRPNGQKEQSKSPNLTRLKPARPALPPTMESCQLFKEVTSQTMPHLRAPAKVPVASPGSRISIEYTYIDPQKVLYPNPSHSEGQEEGKCKTVNQSVASVTRKVSPRRTRRNVAYSLDTHQCPAQYTSLQLLTFSEHEYALPIAATVRRTSEEEESSKTEEAGSQREQPTSNGTGNETGLDVDYMNMSRKFKSNFFTIDTSVPGPRSKTLPTPSRNHLTSTGEDRYDQDCYVIRSPKRLEKYDSGYIDVSEVFETSCSPVDHTTSLQTCPLPLLSEGHWLIKEKSKTDDCKLYLAISPNTLDLPSIYTVPS